MLQADEKQQETPEAKLRRTPRGEVKGVMRDERGPEGEHDEARHGTPARPAVPTAQADNQAEQDRERREPGRDDTPGAAAAKRAVEEPVNRPPVRQRMAEQELPERHVPGGVGREDPMQREFVEMRRREQQGDSGGGAGCEAEERKEGHPFGVMRRDEGVLQAAQPHGAQDDDHRDEDRNNIHHQTDHPKPLSVPSSPAARITTQHRRDRGVRISRLRGRIAGSIAALLVIGVVASAMFLPVSRATDSAVIEFIAVDGTCSQRRILPAELGRLESSLAEEAARLRSITERIMADAAGGRFAEARERVPEFGSWAYDWVQSYITSYRVIARLAGSLAASVQNGEGPEALTGRIMEEVSAPIREEFQIRVLSSGIADALRFDFEHAGAIVSRDWQAALLRAELMLSGLPPATDGAVLTRIDLSALAGSLVQDLIALAPRDALAVVSEQTSDTTAIFMRTMRPMAARLGAVLVRASEAGSIIAAGGAFGYVLAGAPGVVVGAAGGVGVSWMIDWALNRFDAALNRSAFERQALAVIEAAERRIAERAGAAVAQALDERLATLRSSADGCSGAGGPR